MLCVYLRLPKAYMYVLVYHIYKLVESGKTIIHVLNMYVCAVLLPIKMLTYIPPVVYDRNQV